MKVLVVTPWFPNATRPGEGIFNLRDVELLSETHEVTVLHLHQPGMKQNEQFSATDSSFKFESVPFTTSDPRSLLAAKRAIRSHLRRNHLVHTMAFPSLLPAKLAVGSRSQHRKPWVHTEHWSGLVSEPATLRAKIGGRLLRPGLQHPDEVVAVGEPLARAVAKYRVGKSQPVVIANHVRIDETQSLPQAPEARGAQPLVLIGVGGLTYGKGILEAVETVALLKNRGIHAHLYWAGVGPLEHEAGQLADLLGVAGQLTLLGHVAPERLSGYLSRSHIFLLPTQVETFGVALAEGLAAGLPVVTSGTGGHHDFLPKEVSRIVEKQSESLAAAVIDLIDAPDRWAAAEIRQYAKQRFAHYTRKREYERVYQQALEKRTPSSDTIQT